MGTSDFHAVLNHAADLALELIDAPRALPILEESDYRVMRYYVQHFHYIHTVLFYQVVLYRFCHHDPAR